MKSLLDQIFAEKLAKKVTNFDSADVMFRRTTNRYGPIGTFSKNKVYLTLGRCEETGRFISPRDL